jgi:hypothetical protein
MGNMKISPAANNAQVETKMFIYGIPTASARHTPAAPADCKDWNPRLNVFALTSCHMTYLIEASKMCELARIIGHGSHEPVSGRLPHCVEQATEDVQKDTAYVGTISEVELGRLVLNLRRLPGIVPIIEILS